MYFLLSPEVAGELGEHTLVNVDTTPPTVERLHFVFSDWLGDDVLESFPVFLVTKTLADQLTASGLDTFTFAEAEISLFPEAKELLQDKPLPEFVWWQVTGRAGVDDFGLTDKAELVVSEAGLAVLQGGRLAQCDVEAWEPENEGG